MDNGESVSVRELAAALDEVCEQLCVRVSPLPCPEIKNRQDIWEQVKRLGEIVDNIWGSDFYKTYKGRIEKLEALVRSLNEENEELQTAYYTKFDKVNREICEIGRENEALLKQLDRYALENGRLKEKLAVYEKKKTKTGNKNAYRDDIDPSEVYRLARIEGMSISAIARKYNVSTVTIRKRLEIGEKNRLE